MLLLVTSPRQSHADSWSAPTDSTYHSANGQFQFHDTVGGYYAAGKKPTGTLRRKSGDKWEMVWTNTLVNGTCPVSALLPDSGRYVITFDEYHSVGENPVVIYGAGGRLVANLTLSDLKLRNHPKISQSVSSYWWNQKAIILLGPEGTNNQAWSRMLEDSLFIRLYWGEVLQIDLASGKVRDAAWWQSLSNTQAEGLKKATDEYLTPIWLRLAREYFRKENFEPDPTDPGVKGLLLVGQLRLREALPLAREIAATDRFQHWSAPSGNAEANASRNVQALARKVVAELESGNPSPPPTATGAK